LRKSEEIPGGAVAAPAAKPGRHQGGVRRQHPGLITLDVLSGVADGDVGASSSTSNESVSSIPLGRKDALTHEVVQLSPVSLFDDQAENHISRIAVTELLRGGNSSGSSTKSGR